MTIRWITSQLGTSPWVFQTSSQPFCFVDVRTLKDGHGNPPEIIKSLVIDVVRLLENGREVVVCCDHGISRSNGIATAALAIFENITFNESLLRVIHATGESEIKITFLKNVRQAVGLDYDIHLENHPIILGKETFIGRKLEESLRESVDFPMSFSSEDLVANQSLLETTIASSRCRNLIFCWRPKAIDTTSGMGKLLCAVRNTLEVCRALNCYLIFISSNKVFSGLGGPGTRICYETTLPAPFGSEGDAYYLAEILIDRYARQYNLQTLVLRTPTIYGPGDHSINLINRLANSAKSGNMITTHRFANGPPVQQLMYIDDLVQTISLILAHEITGVLHATISVSITTRKLASLIMRECLSKSHQNEQLMPGTATSIELASLRGDEFAQEIAPTALEEGIAKLVRFLHSN